MADMSMDEMEMKDFVTPKAKAPKYPHGLRICLDSASLAKLGVKGIPQVDQHFDIEASAMVVEVEKEEMEMGASGPGYRVYLQIVEMDLMKEEKEDDDNTSTTKVLYGE